MGAANPLRLCRWIEALRRGPTVPVARILGHREFWSLRFHITEATLDPRPDSETLIEVCLEVMAERRRGGEAGRSRRAQPGLGQAPALLGDGVGRIVSSLDVSRWCGPDGDPEARLPADPRPARLRRAAEPPTKPSLGRQLHTRMGFLP